MAPARNWQGKEKVKKNKESSFWQGGSNKKTQNQTNPEKSSCREGLHFQGFLKPSSTLLFKSGGNL